MNVNDPKFLKRVIEMHGFMKETEVRLKRHYKWSNVKIKKFWDDVWQTLRSDKDKTLEEAAEEVGQKYDRPKKRS